MSAGTGQGGGGFPGDAASAGAGAGASQGRWWRGPGAPRALGAGERGAEPSTSLPDVSA